MILWKQKVQIVPSNPPGRVKKLPTSEIVLGAMGNMLWFSSAQKISAQTGYVMDGIQEAVGELIVAVKASSNRLLKLIENSQKEAAQCQNMTRLADF